jgi:hypothetical protein
MNLFLEKQWSFLVSDSNRKHSSMIRVGKPHKAGLAPSCGPDKIINRSP